MFIVLSKFLPVLIYPLGLTCLLILAALFSRRQARRQAILIAALVVLYLGSNELVMEALARSLEWRYLPDGEIPPAEMIVVLAGGVLPGNYPRPMPEIDGTGDRLIYAAHLFHQGKAPKILFTGGPIEWMNSSPYDGEETIQMFELMGVPRNAQILEIKSRNTYESAVACKELLEAAGIKHVILVTSAWHMPRSVALFERQGINVIPAPTDFLATQSPPARGVSQFTSILFKLLPGPDNLSRTTLLLKEYLGLLIYKLRGWI